MLLLQALIVHALAWLFVIQHCTGDGDRIWLSLDVFEPSQRRPPFDVRANSRCALLPEHTFRVTRGRPPALNPDQLRPLVILPCDARAFRPTVWLDDHGTIFALDSPSVNNATACCDLEPRNAALSEFTACLLPGSLRVLKHSNCIRLDALESSSDLDWVPPRSQNGGCALSPEQRSIVDYVPTWQAHRYAGEGKTTSDAEEIERHEILNTMLQIAAISFVAALGTVIYRVLSIIASDAEEDALPHRAQYADTLGSDVD